VPSVASLSLLDSIRVVDGDGSGPRRVVAIIDDAWSILYAQGGVVMAVMLRAAEVVLGRPDLELTATSATFCRPVPSGAVDVDVDVLRGGRNGAQVQVTLRSAGDADPAPNAVATVVFSARAEGWPDLQGPVRPAQLHTPPAPDDPRIGAEDPRRAGLNFFRQTRWLPVDDEPDEPLRGMAWFAFAEPPLRPDGTWTPAMLAVPGDALGLAAVAPVAEVMGRLTAPSLQISLQLHSPVRGDWLGIDSVCFHNAGGVASGLATLWNVDGSIAGTATQTAILRLV
jgi:acyl-CoA thioesterase